MKHSSVNSCSQFQNCFLMKLLKSSFICLYMMTSPACSATEAHNLRLSLGLFFLRVVFLAWLKVSHCSSHVCPLFCDPEFELGLTNILNSVTHLLKTAETCGRG